MGGSPSGAGCYLVLDTALDLALDLDGGRRRPD